MKFIVDFISNLPSLQINLSYDKDECMLFHTKNLCEGDLNTQLEMLDPMYLDYVNLHPDATFVEIKHKILGDLFIKFGRDTLPKYLCDIISDRLISSIVNEIHEFWRQTQDTLVIFREDELEIKHIDWRV